MQKPPAWIDIEAWHEFTDMRRRLKKPLTDRATVRAINRLQELKDAGHDPNASLIQSADHYWTDLYAPKDMSIDKKGGVSSANETAMWMREQDQARARSTKPPAHLLAMVGKR